MRLVKQAQLIYLGQVAREQENTCREPSIGTYIGGIACHTYMLWVGGSNVRVAQDKVQPALRSIRKVEVTMAASDFKTVDEYIAAQPETARVVLKRVRSTIRKALPGAVEVISYKIPAYKLRGGVVLYFAGWKQHYSLYPAGERLVAAFKDQLASYSVSKGTIRFPFSEPVPAKLIKRIAKFRAEETVRKSKRAAFRKR